MGKSTISMAIFNSKLLVYQRVSMFIPYVTGFMAPAYWDIHPPRRLEGI